MPVLPVTEVGLILAISPLVGMLARAILGTSGGPHRSAQPHAGVAHLGHGSGLSRTWQRGGFWSIALATAALAVVGTAIFPIMTSVSLAILRDEGRYAFGRVRVWGRSAISFSFFYFLGCLPLFSRSEMRQRSIHHSLISG